jgi:hypothetical protein
VEFDGTATLVVGVCPVVTFTVGGKVIVTDRSTDFKKGNCSDLRSGRDLSGEGLTMATGMIRATDVRFKKNDKDENPQ